MRRRFILLGMTPSRPLSVFTVRPTPAFGGPHEPRPELLTVCLVVGPVAGGGDPLAGRYGRGVANHGHQFAMAPRLDPHDAEAAVGVVERDPLDQSGEDLTVG